MIKSERNSTFELLRICAMLMIVFYHVVSYYLYELPNPAHVTFYTALLPTLHIGVILFVLISGYFGIRSTWKGLATLLSVVIIYNLPIVIYSGIKHGDWIDRMMFITNTPYWFVRTYLYLYLIAPLLNILKKNWTIQERIGGLIALGAINLYFGSTQGDFSLADGKNLVNFVFLYLLGDTLRCAQTKWDRISIVVLLGVWIIFNMAIFASLYWTSGGIINKIIMNLAFPYRSPLLIINAVLFFLIFSKLHFHSGFINHLATSVFAVYIIHEQPVLHNIIVLPLMRRMVDVPGGGDKILLLTIGIMIVCVIIDQCLFFYWRWQEKVLNKWLGRKELY